MTEPPTDPRARTDALEALFWKSLRKRFWLIILFAVTIAVGRYEAKISKPGNDGLMSRSAFLRWRPQLRELARGADSYAKFNYPNPPVMAMILIPFAELPPVTGAMTWFFLKMAMAGGVLVWAVRLASPRDRPMPDWAKAVVVILSLHPIHGDLSHGNVNIFIAFLVLAGLELFRRGYDVPSGLVLGLAAACKVTPALFLPYLLWKRAWRAAAGMAVGVGLWLFVVPGAAFGFERNVALLGSWWDGMVRPFVVEGKVTPEHANQSIPGLVARLLTHQPSDFNYDEDDGRP
ncbi:MAG: glycosyltransferase family 87 protein, partial [Fimbriiglobus sp.]